MSDRVVIRAHGSILASLIATVIFGALAIFGLRIVVVALGLGEAGLWVWGILAVSLALIWAVLHALWNAFGVVLIISAGGLYKPGLFGGRRIARDGLRVGRYDTLRSNFGGTQSSARARATKTTEFWAWTPEAGATLIWDGPRDAPDVARIEAALAKVMDLRPERMSQGGRAGFDAPQG